MCLMIPGRVTSIEDRAAEGRFARVDFTIAQRMANLVFLPDVSVGDFVIVQAGFATRRVSAEEAEEALAYVREAATPTEFKTSAVSEG